MVIWWVVWLLISFCGKIWIDWGIFFNGVLVWVVKFDLVGWYKENVWLIIFIFLIFLELFWLVEILVWVWVMFEKLVVSVIKIVERCIIKKDIIKNV